MSLEPVGALPSNSNGGAPEDVGGVSVTSGIGSASGNIDGNDAHNYIANLSGVTNGQVITVSLGKVSDSVGNFSSTISISIGMLTGDTNADRLVDSADIGQTKSQSGQSGNQFQFPG